MKNTEFEAMNIEELDLVTGGGGQTGQELVRQAVKAGADRVLFYQTVEDIVNKVKSWFN